MIIYYVELFHEDKSIHSFKINAKDSSDLNLKVEAIMQSSPWKYYGELKYKYATYED